MTAPPAPYQNPRYKKGRRTKLSVPPTNFTTSISARRFSIASLIVLPMDNSTPKPRNTLRAMTKRSPNATSASNRSIHSRSRSTVSILSSAANWATNNFNPAACSIAGVSSITAGNGFSPMLAITFARPDCA